MDKLTLVARPKLAGNWQKPGTFPLPEVGPAIGLLPAIIDKLSKTKADKPPLTHFMVL